MPSVSSAHGDRVSRRSRRALQAQRAEYKTKRVYSVRGELFQIEVFEVVHSVLCEVPLVDGKRQIGALVRDGLDRPGIGPDQRNLTIGQKLCGRETDPGLAGAVRRVVLHPQ